METMNTQLLFTAEKPIFMKMAEVANFPQMSTEQQRIYMCNLNNYRTVLATKDYDLNRGIAIGRAEGHKKGRAEGRAEGIAIGEERERQKAYEEKLASARNLKNLTTLTNAEIALALGLTEEHVAEA